MWSTDDTSKSDGPVIVTKHTKHHVRELLLGTVVGAHWPSGERLVLYYADGHRTTFCVDEAGDIVVDDYEEGLPEC